jgi:ABC-type polysaccharide/polyol phosphate transport system ATPase subunit
LSTLTGVEPGAIKAENLSRRFRVYPTRNVTLKEAIVRRHKIKPTEIWALRDVSLEIAPGESVGVVGRNGSGKTTFLRLLAGIFKPTSGRLAVAGSVGSLLELGAGFHPDFTGRENIYLSGAIYGMKRAKIRDSLDDIIEFTELERFIDLPVRTYSSGMYMRLGFAIASHMDADILLLDEVFAVGDEAFQRKCMDRVLSFKRGGGTTVFVSHSASAVERMCERAVLLRDGQVVLDGETHDVLRTYQGFLADQEAVAEGGPDPSEWGTGEIRVTRTTLEGPGGGERNELDADEPVSLRIWVASEAALSPPQIAVELRDSNGGLLGSHVQSTADLGWDGSPGERVFRFELDRLPVVDGRFRFGVAIYDHEGGRTYHRVERAAEFLVGPAPVAQGWLRFSGRFVLDESASMATVR